ncbi:DUF1176 domain-containing protein [Devosia nitrariae]|uniref:DUF1176 domain-containing protein n=1 Tax=Devosia nitrariae TaxID=2071872 RepID=A0ABQ5VY93_9HYPH|nr:DUF1176 domain-containing protein [Devosia nitrariae]GLQ52772.1 hypothetical protein GCM10010862_00300 [Devosia nitrariae]
MTEHLPVLRAFQPAAAKRAVLFAGFFARFARLALGLLAAVILLPAAATSGQEERTFGTWTASCAPDFVCRAVTGIEPRLRLERHPLQSFWELAIEVSSPPPPYEQDPTIDIDETSETFGWYDESGPYGAANRFYFMGAKAQAVLDRMVNGQSATIHLADADRQRQAYSFSLRGLAAALLWIDEQQYLVGNERLTGVPPYGLLPANIDMDPSIVVPAALVEAHRADETCEPLEDLPNGRDSQVERLDDERLVAILPCGAGAYNFSSKVYVVTGGEFKLQHFAEFADHQSWHTSDQLVNAWYDPASRELVSFNKGRGIADCGSSGTWRWRNFFRLEEYRYKGECDATGDPGEFPVVYTAPPMPEY